APHDDEVKDPPGHRDPGGPPLRRLGDRGRGPPRRGRPVGRRARPHRRRHQRRAPGDLHDRRRARLRGRRHQRRRRPARPPRRHGDPHRLRPAGGRRGQGAGAARRVRGCGQQGPGHRIRSGRHVRRPVADPWRLARPL
ncbi:MAG: Aspartate 1-decarboxylase, partial [uncultured Nocardioides sp.]